MYKLISSSFPLFQSNFTSHGASETSQPEIVKFDGWEGFSEEDCISTYSDQLAESRFKDQLNLAISNSLKETSLKNTIENDDDDYNNLQLALLLSTMDSNDSLDLSSLRNIILLLRNLKR